MATGAILAVAVAVLTSTTLTPAVLATFGEAAAKRSWLLHWSRRPETTQSRFWTRWTGWVMRRPWLSALGATVLLLTLAAPAFSMVLGNSMQRQFDPTHEIRGGVNAAADALGPGALGPVRVLVTFPDGNPASAPAKEPLLQAVQQRMSQAPNVVTVQPAVFGNDYRSALASAVLSVDPEDMGARESVDWMRHELPTGRRRQREDRCRRTDRADQGLRRSGGQDPAAVFGFVALIAFVMLLVSIRSVFLAFKGVLMTVLSVAAAYGSLVVVFQWGWLADLGFRPISSLDSTIPPLVLAMTFGLSMDYEIFLLTRIRERFLQTNNTRDAVAYGVSTSARTITSAALIMIAVFIGFAFAGMPLVAQLGVACAVAIAVDATVVRLILVPALMAMFDEWNWWLPRWLDRILPSVDFEKPLPKATSAIWSSFPTTSLRWRRRGSTSAWWSSRRPSSRPWRRTRSASPTRWRFSGCLPSNGSDCVNAINGHTNGHSHVSGAGNGKTVQAKPRSAARSSRHDVARSAVGGAGRAGDRGGNRATDRRAQQSDGDHQRPAADRRPAVDTDRSGDASAEELPDHVQEQHQRLRRVCRFGRVDGDSNRRCGTGGNGSVLLW